MDLLTPTNHAGAYEWASVFLAHFALGLGLTALVAAILDWIDSFEMDIGDVAPVLVTAGYLVRWEMGVQRLGAGWPDALVDTLAMGLGAYAGLFLWRRQGGRLALVIAVAAAAIWQGVRARR